MCNVYVQVCIFFRIKKMIFYDLGGGEFKIGHQKATFFHYFLVAFSQIIHRFRAKIINFPQFSEENPQKNRSQSYFNPRGKNDFLKGGEEK